MENFVNTGITELAYMLYPVPIWFVLVAAFVSVVSLEVDMFTNSSSCGMLKTPTLAMRYEDIKSIWRVKVEASEILGISKPVFYVYIGVKSGGCHTQAFDTEEQASAFFEETYAKMQNCL